MEKDGSSQILSSKEASNFRSLLKLYESKSYKKAIKTANGILKKHPNHGETLAMKGIVMYFQGAAGTVPKVNTDKSKSENNDQKSHSNGYDKNQDNKNKHDESGSDHKQNNNDHDHDNDQDGHEPKEKNSNSNGIPPVPIPNKKEMQEGGELIKKGLSMNESSYICWHVMGIYYRTEKLFDEAVKCYAKAIKLDPENHNVLRDLAALQTQIRDWKGLIDSRRKLMLQRPTIPGNWTALAVAYHLSNNIPLAINILTKYIESLKIDIPITDIPHMEILMYRNALIYESGNPQAALDDLEKLSNSNSSNPMKILDEYFVLEMRAKCYRDLTIKFRNDKKNEKVQNPFKDKALDAYTTLLNKNPENQLFYFDLISIYDINNDPVKIKKLFTHLKSVLPSDVEVVRRLPLNFLKGDDFFQEANEYIINKINKGVPSLFVQLKLLYDDNEKVSMIQSIAENFYKKVDVEKVDDKTIQNKKLWTLFFLAQHYTQIGNHSLALELINKAILIDKKIVELYCVKAKILKHAGDFRSASKEMETARNLELKDRFVNTKCAKYYLRDNNIEAADEIISFFTKNDSLGCGVGDLHDMQALWFLLEEANAYYRRKEYGLALKRLLSIDKIFHEWWLDQYDFHSYCLLRRGTLISYVNTIKWENNLYEMNWYARAITRAIEIYIHIHDNPRKVESKQESTNKKKKNHKNTSANNTKEITEGWLMGDKDPYGENLFKTNTPLEDAMKLLNRFVKAQGWNGDSWRLSFEIQLRSKKYLLALQAINKGIKSFEENDSSNISWIPSAIGKFIHVTSNEKDETVYPSPIKKIVNASMLKSYKGIEIDPLNSVEFLTKSLKLNNNDLDLSGKLMICSTLFELKDKKSGSLLLELIENEFNTGSNVDMASILFGLDILKKHSSESIEKYKLLCAKKYPLAKLE